MKKILMFALIAGMFLGVNAQEVKFGVKGGMNLSALGGDMKKFLDEWMGLSQKTRVGFHIGAFVDVEMTENFYIQPGLFYSSKGVKAEDSGDKLTMNLNYLEIPILASYRIAVSDNMKWHINAGPYLAYGLGGKIKTSGDGDDDEDYYSYGDDDEGDWDEGSDKVFDKKGGDLKRFDFGLSFGTGMSFNAFYLGLKYDLGLVNIGGETWKEGKVKVKNSNFAISVGYTF